MGWWPYSYSHLAGGQSSGDDTSDNSGMNMSICLQLGNAFRGAISRYASEKPA